MLLVRLFAIGGGEIGDDVDNGGDAGDAGDVGAVQPLLQGRLLGLKEQWTEHR